MINIEKDKYSKYAPQETHKRNIFNFKENSNNPHCTFIQPLPDEFVRGHIGRWGKLLGFKSYSACISNLKRKHGTSGKNSTATPILKLVSAAAGLSCEKYVYLHTLLPFLNFSSPDNVFDSNGEFIDSILRRRSCSLARAQAHFCPMCIEEDKQAIGYSYWKRTHQLPGQLWCYKHIECSLYFIDHKDPFCQLPEYWLNHEKSKSYSIPNNIRNHPKVDLFNRICQTMLESKNDKRQETIGSIFNNKSTAMEISQARNDKYMTKSDRLSDITLKKLPLPFVEILFTQIASKEKRRFFPPIDEVIAPSKKTALPTATALAMTIFYESLEDAFNAIALGKNQPAIKSIKFIKPLKVQKSFIEHNGDFEKISNELSIKKSYLIKLTIKNKGSILKEISENETMALAKFLSGETTINESCTAYSVSPALLEKLAWLCTTKTKHGNTLII